MVEIVYRVFQLSNVWKDKESSTNTQVKYSSVRLSQKSLELCTENLGNETGSDEMMEKEVDLFSYSPSITWEYVEKKKEKRKNFPPPLTTIRVGGSDCLKMKPHREGGRLVIKLQPTGSCFQAERSHGRLRLSFWRNPMEEEEKEEDDDDDDDENEVLEEELENEMIRESAKLTELQDMDEDLKNIAYKETQVTEEIEEEGDENENNEDGNSWNIEGGITIMEKYDTKGRSRSRSRSRSRCKEGDYENNGFRIAALEFLTA
ncbi:hypothetical protein Lal_00014040 [Lupinus albus]|nr:hypothetical protein Lal_00014040 [Lupinus albus]